RTATAFCCWKTTARSAQRRRPAKGSVAPNSTCSVPCSGPMSRSSGPTISRPARGVAPIASFRRQPSSGRIRMTWIDALGHDELAAEGSAIVRHEGRQILLLRTEHGLFACANRCPHEGYPLSEGTLTDGCVLTCNWHNWKFDLASGATLV